MERLFEDILDRRAVARREPYDGGMAKKIISHPRLEKEKLALLYLLLNPESFTGTISHSFNHIWNTDCQRLLTFLSEAKTVQEAVRTIILEAYKTPLSPEQQHAVSAKISTEYSATRSTLDHLTTVTDTRSFDEIYKECHERINQHRDEKSSLVDLAARHSCIAPPSLTMALMIPGHRFPKIYIFSISAIISAMGEERPMIPTEPTPIPFSEEACAKLRARYATEIAAYQTHLKWLHGKEM